MKCISMGRGRSASPHFYFYDIDHHRPLWSLLQNSLVYETKRGAHVIRSSPLSLSEQEFLEMDNFCPRTAVRIYPYDDYILRLKPFSLCIRVAKIYEAIFKQERIVEQWYLPCTHGQVLKFGVYTTHTVEGKKLHGEERVVNRL